MKITEQKVKEYIHLLTKNMKSKRINIPVEARNIYTKNRIMDVVCCVQAEVIVEKINKYRRTRPNIRLKEEPVMLESIAINHIELEVSYMTKRAVFGKVPDADEMYIINSFLQDLGIESDRALLRSLKD